MMDQLERLINLCRYHALNFDLHYSEIEDNFELHVTGPGKGEDFYIKRSKYLECAVDSIEKQLKQFIEQFTKL